MTVLEVIQRSTEFLGRKGVDSPRLQVELLLAHTLKIPRLRLYLDFERVLTEQELTTLRELVKRRGNREPLQHLIGSTSFCGLEMEVSPAVLIPRPETELLAEQAWQWLNASPTPLQVLDFGTGSGCLAITLAVKAPAAQIHALDVSPEALEIARRNAARHQVSERIQFLQSDGLNAIPETLRFDLIVSNPPYIPTAEINTLEPEVRDHDPRKALDGGPDGLKFYRLLAEAAPRLLHPTAKIMLELGDGQAEPVQHIFQQQQWRVEKVLPDLTARPRVLIAHWGAA